MRLFTSIFLIMTIGLLFAETATALPRFAIRTGARCQSCHVNPSGGAMRQAFGTQFGREELPVPTWADEFALDEFSSALSDNFSIGADMRLLWFNRKTGSTSTDEIWQMQGDVYMNFRLARKVNLYLDKGLYRGFEIFALLNIVPANGFVKAGKFVPNYGTKMDDHTVYIRQMLGFSAEFGRPERTGLEVGISPGPISITGGVYNAGSENSFPSAGKKKAFLGRAEGVFKATDDLNLGIGGNIFRKENSFGAKTTMVGGFGGISYKDLTLFGETDWTTTDSVGAKVTGLVGYAELNYMVTQGVDLKFAYDFYDPNIDVKSGSVSRYSFGVEFFPIAGVEVRPVYRHIVEDPDAQKVDNDEFHLLLHFYF